MSAPILLTKLFIPSSRPELVSRTHLIEQLNLGLDRKLSLISAPAGFGKTTLITEWINSNGDDSSSPFLVAWLSLDEGDNDVVQFLTYLISSLNRLPGLETDIGGGALQMIQSPQPPPPETVLISLINEITLVTEKIILILDDYHLIDSLPVHNGLQFLLENMPPQLHLVITTREDPPISISRLRARGQVTEIRALDLQFTSPETAEFLNQVMGLNLSIDDIAALEARTEGWIAGLQLAAISLQGQTEPSRLIQAFTGSHRHVLDYLIEEVLSQQTESVQTFLLQTSILNRLSGSLCDAITGQKNGQETLDGLDRANLFVIPLDNDRLWYRYHHLFTDVLKARLVGEQPDQVAILHLRASEWYELKDFPSEAIRHALAADDFERAADLAELAWPAWSDAAQAMVWFGWVKTLPDEIVRARPVLSIAFAQAHLLAGNLEAVETRLLDAERWLESTADIQPPLETATSKTSPEPGRRMVFVNEEQFRELPISVALARAYQAQAIGNVPGTIQYAQQVLDIIPEEDHPLRDHAIALLGLAYWLNGDSELARQTFSDGLAGNIYAMVHGAHILADMNMTLGHLNEASRILEHALQLAAEHGEPISLGVGEVYICRSNLLRERGDLEAAAQDLARSKMLCEQVELLDWQYSWRIAQARLKQTQGFLDDALELLDEAEHLYIQTASLEVVRPIAAMKARVWVAQGRLTAALDWVRERGLSAEDDPSFLREFEHITLARVLIACYKHYQEENYIRDALRLIGKIVNASEEAVRTGNTIEIIVLQALAHQAHGDIPAALSSLEKALTLAEPEGYCRIFVDEGPPMARLLYTALEKEIQPDYVRKLLAAFPADQPENDSKPQTQTSEFDWVEPLSERELEVLQLIAEGLTNDEISTRLYLSPNTVKTHARNIYSKMGVKGRTKAVARARAMGLLKST